MQDPESASYATSLLVGVPEIDNEHQAIFRRISAAVTALRAGKGDAPRHTFRALIEAFRTHFTQEERMMAAAGYHGIPGHAAHHGGFLARLEALAKAGDDEGDAAIAANFDAFDTLFRDAMNGDLEFAAWLQAR